MTSFRTLLKIASLFFVITVFQLAQAVDHDQNLVDEDVPPPPDNLMPAESESENSHLQNSAQLSGQVERAFRSLFQYKKLVLLEDQGPLDGKVLWKKKVDSIQNPLVQNGVLKKLATSSTAHNQFFLNAVMRYILMEKMDGWNFKEAIPILKQNKNYSTVILCLVLRKWRIDDSDCEFVKNTFERGIKYYHPEFQCVKLCRKLLEYKVSINGTEEAAVGFIIADTMGRRRPKEEYLRNLIHQPLRPETKNNLMLQLYTPEWKSWVKMLNRTMGWQLPLNITLPQNHSSGVSNVLQYITGFFNNDREHPKMDDGTT